jgi:hypothetical protein
MWIVKLEQPPERLFPQVTPAMLDRDQLEKDADADWDWRMIADAASVRRMFGLAAYAIEQWEGIPLDAEDAKDIDDIETNRAMEENMLVQMYEQRGPTVKPIATTPPKHDTDFAKSDPDYRSSVFLTPVETSQRSVSPSEALESPAPDLPALPLILSVRITPIEGPVGVPTMMEAELSNPTDDQQLVNRRMLINHVDAPEKCGLRWMVLRVIEICGAFECALGKPQTSSLLRLLPVRAYTSPGVLMIIIVCMCQGITRSR